MMGHKITSTILTSLRGGNSSGQFYLVVKTYKLLVALREILSYGFLTRSDTNQAVQPQKMTTAKAWILDLETTEPKQISLWGCEGGQAFDCVYYTKNRLYHDARHPCGGFRTLALYILSMLEVKKC